MFNLLTGSNYTQAIQFGVSLKFFVSALVKQYLELQIF